MSLLPDQKSQPVSPQRIAVIGGGMAGLAAAYRLLELDPTARVTLFEASDRLGGVLQTEQRDGWLIERSADSFITNMPAAIDLCRRIGLDDELIGTDRRFRRALVVRAGKLHPVPAGFVLMTPGPIWPILNSPLLSLRGKLRVIAERWVPRKSGYASSSFSVRDLPDESLASFVRRRLGTEAFDRLVQPLVGGIYTADPERLSLAATLPRFLEMEREHGSLTRAAAVQRALANNLSVGNALRGIPESQSVSERHGGTFPTENLSNNSGARYELFTTPRRGMSMLVDTIVGRLPRDCVRLKTRVERIERTAFGVWQLSLRDFDTNNERSGLPPSGFANAQPTDAMESFDAVIIATPAPMAARLLESIDRPVADELRGIEHAGSTIVSLGYDRSQIEHPLDAFGFVVPAIDRRKILAASFSSVKFPGRAPDGKVLIRTFVGGALQPDLGQLPDDELQAIVRGELGELLGARGEPEICSIARWTGAMPQYHLGHLDRIARIEEQMNRLDGLELCGNAYHGVGVPNCIRDGELAAERVTAHLEGRKR